MVKKKEISFVLASMRLDLTKEQYKDLNKLISDYAKKNKWKLMKEKEDEGYSISLVIGKASPKQVFNFIENIKKMLKEIDEIIGVEAYPDNYTDIQYWDFGDKRMIAFKRYSNMMLMNIMEDDAIRLDKENTELATAIFGDYYIQDDEFHNVRIGNFGGGKSLFGKIKDFFTGE